MPSTPITYADLEIRVLELSDERYPVEITFSGEREFPRGYLNRDIVPWIPSVSPPEDGERLFDLLFADDRLKRAWAAARSQSPALRIRLRIDASAPELHAIPWELLREGGPGRVTETLSADADTPFSRYMAGEWRHGKPVSGRPIKLLAVIANPANLPVYRLTPIDVEAERRNLAAALAGLEGEQIEMTFLQGPVTLSALEDELKRGYHILHIVAHGLYNRQQGRAVLFLGDGDNQAVPVGEDDFAEMLVRQGDALRLIFLASCQTATRSPAGAFRGYAPKLVAAGVPAVVAMQDLVPVKAARIFAAIFYRRLLRHGLVDVAANEARSAMLTAGLSSSWAVPVLFSRVSEGAILEPSVPSTPMSLPDRIRRIPVVARAIAIGSALFGLLTVMATVLGLLSGIQPLLPTPTPTPTPIPPMPSSGFNIAVAQFSLLDATGHLTSTEESREVSGWLFDAITKEIDLLPSSLRANKRGPVEIGMIEGTDADTRATKASVVARQHNATLLIYGVLTEDGGAYSMELEFFVSSTGFDYGSEILGPGRLGVAVPYSMPLGDPATVAGVNEKLNARAQALQHIVAGLAQFYIRRYDKALLEFQDAEHTEHWQPDEGQEVVYMLEGAARLRADNPEAGREQRLHALDEAARAFERARQLNPSYARSYLGLGTVALQQASIRKPTDAATLAEATRWFSASLSARDQPPLAYVPAKTAYGLGQAHLLGSEQNLPGWSADQARRFFTQVITTYAAEPVPDLAWYAGHSHAYLGALAAREKDWPTMSSEYQKAVDLLRTILVNPPNNWIAYYWSNVAYAEKQSNNLDAAGAAYRHALEIGRGAVSPVDLENWQRALDRLGAGAP